MSAAVEVVADLPATVLEERRRLARELHDGVVQDLVALAYQVDDAASLVDAGPALEAVAALRDEVVRLALEVRASIDDLRREPELQGGLSEALSSYADEIGRRGDLRVHLHLDDRGARPPAAVEQEVLKVAREAISNVHRHALAVNLWVRLVTDGDRLLLVVEDDGVGTVSDRSGHFGLQGMRERAEHLGATLAIGVRQDGGTVVTLAKGFAAAPTERRRVR